MSTKNVLCLSCGRGETNFIPPVHTMKGTDGKFYKVDGTGVSKGHNWLVDTSNEQFDLGKLFLLTAIG